MNPLGILASASLNPPAIFAIGLGLLGLLVAYFVLEKENNRRYTGSLLAVAVAAFCIFSMLNYPMQLGIDLKGGTQFILQLQQDGEKEIDEDAVQQVMTVLRDRLDEGGVTDLSMQPQGDRNIVLQMPGISEEERNEIRDTLRQTAKLEIALVHPQASDRSMNQMLVSLIREGEVIPGYTIAEPYDPEAEDAEAVVVELSPSIEGKNVKNAFRGYGNSGNYIGVEMFPDAGRELMEITREQKEQERANGERAPRRMAVLIDGKNASAPSIQEPIGANFQISGNFTVEEANQLATFLKNPLQNEIKIINESSISAAMGQDTIRQGMWAGIAGLSITLLFVIFYYKGAGVVATLGLAVNVVIIFGVMSMFQFVLTMPGIAGVILTIGIGIDANVLIYERLREELKAGKSVKAALDAAYDKAFSAIFDANLTSLIAAAALLWFATGTIKGFAITLIIGVFGSLFCAMLVTRMLFGWLTAMGLLKKMSLWSIITDQNIDFLSMRRTALFVSTALIIGAIAFVGVKQDQVLGVGLRGGDLLTIQTQGEDDLHRTQVEESLSKSAAGLSTNPIVQEQENVGQDSVFITIRTAEGEGDKARAFLREDLGMEIPNTSLEMVGSSVGKNMLIGAIKAMAVGLFGILLYVTIRFEFAFALGALAALFHDLIVVVGLLTLLGNEITLIVVGALLTIAGYSINDTIVVFDRIREGLQTKKGKVRDVMNLCLNATLSRTILTSTTTLVVVITLFIFGGPSLREFAMTLIIGILVGTYSSIFVASPLVLWWARVRKINLRHEVLDTEAAKVAPPAATNA